MPCLKRCARSAKTRLGNLAARFWVQMMGGTGV